MADDTKAQVEKIEKSEKTTVETVPYYEATGRRKNATARARLHVVKEEPITISGTSIAKGVIVVNGRLIEQYFPGEVAKKMYLEPFRTTNTIGRFAVSITVVGGGPAGQLGAAIHSLARALEKVDKEKFRPILKKRGLMTRDPRKKQRIKAGFAHKSRARKQSPKR